MRKVLITDYAWKSLDIERNILAAVGAELAVAESGEEQELRQLAPAADAILTCWKPVTRAVIERASRCVMIGRYGVGLDNIDVGAASEHGIVVTNVPDYCVEEVSDHALALLLACARKVARYDGAIKGGKYDMRAMMPMFRIAGKTLGIAGAGRIGFALARKAAGLGLRIIVYDIRPLPIGSGLEQVGTFEELLSRSDFLSVHVPLNEKTHHLFNRNTLRKMKRTAYLINTCRGGVVESAALIEALDEGLIAGAGLDVFEKEPPPQDDPLIRHPKVVATPHAAFYSEESLEQLQATAAKQVAEMLSGRRPDNMVNPDVFKRGRARPSTAS
jgi:D-3-phosphoglycerate dehydrogenase / 2-oxoglutarate reductase